MDRKSLLLYGLLAGGVAAVLAWGGNPKNMAICVACFIRDIAGATKFHNVAVVQYFRPEIAGFVIGSFVLSLFAREYRPTAGSSPMIRVMLGMVMMIGALLFLGCPTRMVLRMAGGDISAYIGWVGFVLGVGTGSLFLRKGFSLGRAYPTYAANGYILPLLLLVLFAVSVGTTALASSKTGPGSVHAPVFLSLVLGGLFGMIANRSRMCFAGGFRDWFLMRNYDLLLPVAGIFVVMLGYNLLTGNFSLAAYGPVAHAQVLWNILGLYIVGFAGVLLGGCPLRQLILAGQGSVDSALTVLGMFLGAAVSHNFSLAAAPAGSTALGGPGLNGQVAAVICLLLLFSVAWVGVKRKV